MAGEPAKLLPIVVTAKPPLGAARNPSPAKLTTKTILRTILTPFACARCRPVTREQSDTLSGFAACQERGFANTRTGQLMLSMQYQ